MFKQIAVLALAIGVPGTAGAWDWGTVTNGTLDIYAVPRAATSTDGSATVNYADGAGLKGTFRVFGRLGFLAEYKNLHGVASVTGPVAVESGGTTQDFRIGPGYVFASGSGLFAEYASQSRSGGGSSSIDGWGGRARLASQLFDLLHAYVEVGQITFSTDIQDIQQAEAAIGGVVPISGNWGLYSEYKRLEISPDTGTDSAVDEFRIGLRASLDY